MSRLITRTIYGDELTTATMYGLPYPLRASTTLNEALGINETETLPEGTYPKVGYWVIGNKGHRTVAGASGIPHISAIKHRPSDANLFGLVPFVLRLESNDLAPSQRNAYALRRREQHGGQNYIAYYAKRLNMDNVETVLQKISGEEGNETVTSFTPDTSNLNPTQPSLSSTDTTQTVAVNDLSVSAIANAIFNATDIAEFIEVAKILYGSANYADISELGICSGVDRSLESPGIGSSTIQMNEVVGCQITQHITTYANFSFTNEEMTFTLEAGSSETLPIEG